MHPQHHRQCYWPNFVSWAIAILLFGCIGCNDSGDSVVPVPTPKAATPTAELSDKAGAEEILLRIGELTQQAVQASPPNYELLLEAGTLADRLQNSAKEIDVSGKQLLATAFYNQACAYSRKSEKDKAFTALDRALSFGFDDVALLKEDADLAGVRDDERFSKLTEKMESVAKQEIETEVNEALASTEPFPFDFSLENIEGKKVSLSELRGSKVTIVDIWGTWCPPCRMEIPHFVELHQQWKQDGLQIVGINYERGEKEDFIPKIEEYRKEAGIEYPLVLGDDATRNQVPEFQGYPTTLFLDSEGIVRAKLVGYHPKEMLEGVVKRLMEKAK